MDKYILFVAGSSGIIILLIAAILFMYCRHRKIVRKKSSGIIRQIHKQDELAKELERERIQKETLMELLLRREAGTSTKIEFKE